MSRARLTSSFISVVAIIGFACWCAFTSFPVIGHPKSEGEVAGLVRTASPFAPAQADLAVAPIPADPHEPATGAIQVPATPAERAAVLSLLERALQNADMHMPGSPPFRVEVSFIAGGNASYVGSGELTEIWLSGQSWRWTANLGSYSQVQIGSRGVIYSDKQVPVPMRVHVLRDAIFWPVRPGSAAAIRAASVQWNGKPATCILLSRGAGSRNSSQTRLWQEIEYCVDNASGRLQVYSIAPGSYAVYAYSKSLQFHGRLMPDRVTIHVAGEEVIDAQIQIGDAGSVDENMLSPTPRMVANGPAITLALPERFPMNVRSASVSGAIKPVIVHAEIDVEGNVLEEELVSAADPALGQPALNLIKKTRFPPQGTQRQVYITVGYTPWTF